MRIEIKPLSVNECFQGRRFKTQKYKLYERELMFKLKPLTIPEPPLKLVITYGFSSKLADVDNPAKGFIDVLQKKYKFNDRDIFELIQRKEIVKKGDEFIDFEITNLKEFKTFIKK
jgi:Holliday junction resolvase RusA-like endonuclease